MEGVFKEVSNVWAPNPRCERGFGFQVNSNEMGSKLVYGSEKNLVVRDYEDPRRSEVYTDHRGEVIVAKFSHRGDVIASGDSQGAIHILKLKNDGTLQLDKQLIGIAGRIFDLSWYPDDKGLACGGDSKGVNARAFTLSGLDQGTIQAAKRVTSVDISHCAANIREAQLVTGTDENRARTYVYSGGFKAAEKDVIHDNSCNMVRFSPSSPLFASVGGKSLKLNDSGNEFTLVSQVADAHKGTIYAVAWSPDSAHLLTASADKTVKLWDSTTLKCVTTFNLKGQSRYKKDVIDFQVGCCFAGTKPVSLALSGDLNYLDGATGQVERTAVGPSGAVASLDVTPNGDIASISTAGEILLYCSSEGGNVKRSAGLDEPKKGVGAVFMGGQLYSTSFDDRVRETEAKEMKLTSSLLNLEHQPVSMRRTGSRFVVTTASEVYVLENAKRPIGVLKLGAGQVGRCGCVSEDGKELAVGTSDKYVRFYAIDNGGKIVASTRPPFGPLEEEPESLAYGADKLAVGLKTKYVKVLCRDGTDFCEGNWCRHSSSVFDVDFSPDGTRLLSCGGEGTICVWDCSEEGRNSIKPLHQFKLAHKTGVVQSKWIDNTSFFSAGRFDGTVKQWTL